MFTDDDHDTPLPPAVLAALGETSVWAEPPPELEGLVLTALRTTSAPATDDRARDDLAGARARRTRRRSSPRLLLALAASVVVLGLLVSGGLALRDGGPEPAVAALHASELAPGADGRASVTDTPSGVRIELDISGLPPAPRGTYYQAWVKGPRGLVTVGTFHGRGGTEDVVLWSGVDVAAYPTLTITLQQEGAGAESSGQVLLSGQIG